MEQALVVWLNPTFWLAQIAHLQGSGHERYAFLAYTMRPLCRKGGSTMRKHQSQITAALYMRLSRDDELLLKNRRALAPTAGHILQLRWYD
jgi:hypothetical protein